MRFLPSIVLLLLPLEVVACGLDWSHPKSYFDNVDFQGHVQIAQKVADMENLPIYLIFNSSYGNSPYAGAGFEIPLLESRIWQRNENEFAMKSPSGEMSLLRRTNAKDPTILEGSGGWKGVVKDDTISVWLPCGTKMVFRNGRISTMQLINDQYSYHYQGNRVESIHVNGRSMLEVQCDGETGRVTGIGFPRTKQHIELKQEQHFPRVKNVGGSLLVSNLDWSLKKIVVADLKSETFEFGLDREMRSTLNKGHEFFVWDSITRTISTDGPWSYRVKPDGNELGNAEIERKHANGTRELWHLNGEKGFEETVSGGEEKTVRYWFTSGLLSGKPKAVTKTINGKTQQIQKWVYDEFGRLVRDSRQDRIISYTYTEDLVKSVAINPHNGVALWNKEENKLTGRKIYQYSNDTRVELSPMNQNQVHVEMQRRGKTIQGIFKTDLEILSLL